MNSKLICIVGPTGVGKSEVAFHLAKLLNAEILSADAFQIYRGVTVGTNQPPAEWMREVPHHFISSRDPATQSWSAADFALEARALLDQAGREGRKMLVVGGSGFYLQALLEGAPPGEAPDPETRRHVLEETRRLGTEGSLRWLRERDPQAAERIHPNDLKRISRALEKSLSPPQTVPQVQDPLVSLVLGLERSRDRLDQALQIRTKALWRGGLLDETKDLIQAKVPREASLWGAIGYQESADFLEGRLGEPEALERMYRRTRQYAKRQMTWFRHHHGTRWFDLDRFETSAQAAEALYNILQAGNPGPEEPV